MTLKEKIDRLIQQYEHDFLVEDEKVQAIIASGTVPNNHWQERYHARERLAIAKLLKEVIDALG